MKEFWVDFTVSFDAKHQEECDEIVARLKKALESTEWKVEVEVINIEEA